MRKYASLEVLEAWRQRPAAAGRITRHAHRVAFDYQPRDGYLYVRSRMISSRTNDNHDTFPAPEIEKGYRSFLGKPVFVNHHNDDHKRARGVIVAVALHRDSNRDGTPDTWVEGLMEVDATRFPKLAKAVLAGRVNRTSMGVDVEWSKCSACGNKATSPAEYCKHLPALKGKKIRQRNQVTGKVEEKLIHEVCAGLSFFENSLLVEDPADPTAYLLGEPDSRGMGKTASADGGPDFRDHLGNTCRTCGDPVKFNRSPRALAPFRHDTSRLYDHDARAVDRDDRSSGLFPADFGGTHCAVCHEPVKVNLRSLNINGGWYHEDGHKRDHDSVPADPQAVYDSVPGVRAQYEQARHQVSDDLHGKFEQLSGKPLPRKPRGDEHQMPPDPFTASRKTAGWTDSPDHCANCGTKFGSMHTDTKAGSWPHQSVPFLCNDCMGGHLGGAEHATKAMPVRPMDQGGTRYHPVASESMDYPEDYETGKIRPWQQGDGLPHSLSAKRPRGGTPKPVRGYGSEPKFDGVSLKKDNRGFFVHTRRARSDSYPAPDDIPDSDIDRIRASAAGKAEGGDHPWFRAHPVSADNIVAAYHAATDDERALGDRWYSDAHHVARAIGKGDSALGAGLLSAYSPRALWPVNLFNASRAAQGDPPGPGTGAMGMHQKAAMRILGGEHHSQVLKAPKTAAFAKLIEHGGPSDEDVAGGREPVVIDRHAMSVAAGKRLTDEEKEGMPIGASQHYEFVADKFRDASRTVSQHYGRRISPEKVQAGTWLYQVRKNAEEDASGSKGGGGKGRAQMGDNSRRRWVDHHREHHPDQISQENLHYHGSLEEQGPQCTGCSGKLGPGAKTRSRVLPHLCADCAERHVQGDDMRAQQPPWMSRQFGRSDMLGHSQSSLRALAYGETRVPPQVDTLRMDECPVCGEHNVWSGSRCPVCGFVVPPSVFRDPDTAKAGEVRDQLDSSGDVTLPPDADAAGQPAMAQPGDMPGSAGDVQDQLVHPDQIAPDGVPAVQGGGGDPVAGAEDDAMVPPGQQDPAATGPGAEQDPEAAASGEVSPEDEGGDMYAEELACPACGTTFEADAAAQPGVPCPACGMAALHPADEEDPGAAAPEGAEDPSAGGEQPEEEQDEEDEDKDMPESKTAAAVARAQARRIAELSARNEVLEGQLRFLASAAGVEGQFAEIQRRVMTRHADILNPASPVPDPPEGPPTETTEQALAPETMDNAGRPGTTPGANSRVPAQQTTTAITPGVEIQTPPATNLVDVTAPVQGTNPSQDGGVPLSQRRIETDVRVDPDPLKASGPGIGGQGNNGAAFPWVLDARDGGQQGGQQKQSSLEGDASRRTFASIRLAKLRVQAGLAQGEELAVAERIERDAALATPVIEHEIGILSQMPLAQQRQAARPVQRTAARSVPSLASVGASAQYAPAAADDLDASDLFD